MPCGHASEGLVLLARGVSSDASRTWRSAGDFLCVRARRRERDRDSRRCRRVARLSSTCAVTAARSSSTAAARSGVCERARSPTRSAARTTGGPTDSTARCAARRSSADRRRRPRAARRSRRWPSSWGGFVFVHLRRARRGRLARRAARADPGANRALSARRAPPRCAHHVRGRGELEGARGELQRVLPLRPVHPELCELVPDFRRGGAGELDWERGIPHRDGTYTFTTSGTTTRAPFPGLDADERVRHKGELVYPNLFLSLSCRSRGRVRARATGRGAHDRRVRLPLPSRRDRTARLRPERRGRALGSGEPAGLDDLRERAARHELARGSPAG